MNTKNNLKNIFLCGFMGCGKSTVGAVLAQLLQMKFVDMDKYIEDAAGESVQNIFKNHGEARFRSLEFTAARELSQMNGFVVATGGGAVLSNENVDAMKSGGIIVLIDVPLKVISARLDGDTTRPLLKKPDKKAAMRLLYDARMPIYRAAADITVTNADNRPEKLVARDIENLLFKQ